MAQDRYSEMERTVLEIGVLLQKLAHKICSLLILLLEDNKELSQRQEELSQRQDDIEYLARIEYSALRERSREFESMPICIDGEIRSRADYYDGDDPEAW